MNTNQDVLNFMKTRRSIRNFKPDMVPKEVIDEIITAGTYAASGMNRQSPVIIAVTDKEVRDRLSKLNAEIMGTDSDPFWRTKIAEPISMTEVWLWEILCLPLMGWESEAAGYTGQRRNLNGRRARKYSNP